MKYYYCENCGELSKGILKICPVCHVKHHEISEAEHERLKKRYDNEFPEENFEIEEVVS